MESTESGAREPFINHRYRVLKQLGAGAMGTVHLVADSLDDNQPLALKTIRSEFVSSYGYSAFKNEFQAMTNFHHPNVVEVHEFGTLAGTEDDFFTMEYVEGKNLFEACRSADLDTLYDYVIQIGRALEYIHAQGFIHFDLKPDNIMVRTDGTVKVMDFGLVETASYGQSSVLKGTIHYLAPEMLRGDQVDSRLDLYSLGAVLYHVLTGKTLFEGSLEQIMYGHLHDPPNLASRPGAREIPGPLQPLLARLLEKDPASRPGSATEFLIEFARLVGRAEKTQVREASESHILGSRSVGRDAELTRLKELFVARVLEPKPGALPAALITGAAGIGKSRLVQELRHHVQLRRVRFHAGSSLQNGGQPYLPFSEILRSVVRDILPEAATAAAQLQARTRPASASSVDGHGSDLDAATQATFTRPAAARSASPSSDDGVIGTLVFGGAAAGGAEASAAAHASLPGSAPASIASISQVMTRVMPIPLVGGVSPSGSVAANIQALGQASASSGNASAAAASLAASSIGPSPVSSAPGNGTLAFGIASSDVAHLGSQPGRPVEPMHTQNVDPVVTQALVALLREHSAAVSRLVGEEAGLKLVGLDVEPPRFSQPEREKVWLLDSVCRFLIGTSRLRPMVLSFSDFQWADPLSVELFGQLARTLAKADASEDGAAKLLLSADYRQEEVVAGAPLEKLAAELIKEKLAEPITLEALKAGDVAGMLGSMLGPVDGVDAVAQVITTRTQGNPFFIEATVRNLLEEGALVRRGATWAFKLEALQGATAATTVQEVLDRTLTKLPPSELEVLRLLSVFNRPVNVPVLRGATTLDEKALRRLLTTLRKKRFVARGWADGHHQHSLRHNTLRDHVYQGVADAERGSLHESAGASLERAYGASERYLEDLAHHFHRAQNLDKAIHYARQAADQAKRLYDNKRSAALYLQALDAHRLLGADLAVSVAEVSYYTPSEKNAERLKAALPIAEEAKDPARMARIQNWMGRTYYALGKQKDAIQAFTAFMKTTEGTTDDSTRALPHAVLGRVGFFLARFEAATKHLDRAIALYRNQVGAEEDISYALGMGGSAYAYLGDLARGRKMVGESIELATQINNPTRLALGRVYMGIDLAHFGRWPEAREWLDRGIELSKKTGDVIGTGTGSSFRGLIALAEGDVAKAVELTRFGREHIAKAGGSWTFTMIGTHMAEALLAAGDVDGALKAVKDTLPVLDTGERWGESCLYVAAGRIHAKRGDPTEARSWFQKALTVAETQKGRPFEAKARLALGAFHNDQGEAEAGAAELEKARKLFDALKMGWYRDRAEALLEGGTIGPCP